MASPYRAPAIVVPRHEPTIPPMAKYMLYEWDYQAGLHIILDRMEPIEDEI